MKYIRYALFFINLTCVFLFLISCLAPFINPQIFWFSGFAGLGFLPLLLANFFWIAFWILFKRKFALVSLIALLLGSWNIVNHVSVASCPTVSAGNSFSIMSFNVKVFDLYTWNNYPGSRDALLRVIEYANPDVLCLQEFYENDLEQQSALTSLKMRYPYFHFHKILTLNGHSHWGIATFSKFPITGRNAIEFPDAFQNQAVATDIIIQGDTLRVFNAHLQSIFLDRDDFANLTGANGSEKIEPSFWRIFRKMKDAFIKRAAQAEILAEQIAESPYKVFVCADFNDTPNSYTYRVVSEGLNDSFKAAGCGIGRTFSSQRPLLRIDYILADKRIRIHSHQVIRNFTSDHFGVKASFDL
ncbi:MAG TPA: endonuclease/exonuclease/phosphatase family protein [Chitinophagales bacterium]|nr:endonuclease/exonuclease/phosphatase family protein [Chitinophagales bacterium]